MAILLLPITGRSVIAALSIFLSLCSSIAVIALSNDMQEYSFHSLLVLLFGLAFIGELTKKSIDGYGAYTHGHMGSSAILVVACVLVLLKSKKADLPTLMTILLFVLIALQGNSEKIKEVGFPAFVGFSGALLALNLT